MKRELIWPSGIGRRWRDSAGSVRAGSADILSALSAQREHAKCRGSSPTVREGALLILNCVAGSSDETRFADCAAGTKPRGRHCDRNQNGSDGLLPPNG